MYVQASPLGAALLFYPGVTFTNPVTGTTTTSGGGSVAAYKVDAEVGFHVSGRHDGFVLAVRQAFYVRDGTLGTTSLRLGWDIPIAIGDHGLELTIAPYAQAGIGYAFSGGDPNFHFGFGVDGRLFFEKSLGLYAFVRPVEVSFFVNDGTLPAVSFGAGAGYAF
ncbi:hypothetical protein BH09MYX1_BH09MYX1_36250 [soil metagenome]